MLGLHPLASQPLGFVGIRNVDLTASNVVSQAPVVDDAVLTVQVNFAGMILKHKIL